MKCNQPRPGLELISPCPFPTTITITTQAPPFSLCIPEVFVAFYDVYPVGYYPLLKESKGYFAKTLIENHQDEDTISKLYEIKKILHLQTI